MTLTPKQVAVLLHIRDSIDANGCAPTLRELSDHFGLNKVVIYEHVTALIKKSYLVKHPNKSRGVELAEGVSIPGDQRPIQRLVDEIEERHPAMDQSLRAAVDAVKRQFKLF